MHSPRLLGRLQTRATFFERSDVPYSAWQYLFVLELLIACEPHRGLVVSTLGGRQRGLPGRSHRSPSVCVAPNTANAAAPPPQFVNNTAVEYPDTQASTDTILRPTPLGVQELSQIRDASAPEAQAYQVTLSPGQYLQQLYNGSVAVIDPTRPTISGQQPPGASGPGSLDGPYDVTENSPSFEADGSSDDPSQYTDQDLAGIAPADAAVMPNQTAYQYENEDIQLQTASAETDGQGVALFTAPWARDAAGTDVPSTLTVTAPNIITYSTLHRSASYQYPVMASHKSEAMSFQRQPSKVFYQLDGQGPSGFSSQNAAQTDGVPRIIAARNITRARFIMSAPDACDAYLGGAKDLRPATNSPEYQTLFADSNDSNASAKRTAARRCRALIDFVTAAQTQGLTNMYVTMDPRNSLGLTARQYAQAISRLWSVQPFNQVKSWGPTNEPDYGSLMSANKAADIWRRLKGRADGVAAGANTPRCPGCHIVAGEFAHYKPNTDTYVHNYIDFLKNNNYAAPYYWGFHDYADVTYQEYKKHSDFPELKMFAKLIKSKYSARKRIWVSEAGVLLRHSGGLQHPGNTTKVYMDPGAQDKDGHRWQDLAAQVTHEYPKVSVVAYYSFFGRGLETDWDSALVSPSDPTTQGDSGGMPNPDTSFRSAYCVVAKRARYTVTGSPCFGADGK